MNLKNTLKNPLITGTLLLSGAGISSRFMGFFFRIFLSRTIGAEGLGLYQLVLPLITLSFAATASGLQTAISKFVAESKTNSVSYCITGIILSCSSSGFLSFLIYKYSIPIATYIFGNASCYSLIQIAAFSFIPASFHACVNGYYLGLKKASVPAFSQLIEQIVRVGSVYIIFIIKENEGVSITPDHAMWGIAFSEIAGMIFCMTVLFFNKSIRPKANISCIRQYINCIPGLCSITVPITVNHFMMNLFSSAENILIPRRLELYGMNSSASLSSYGILSGVALPVIFFPGVITNSLSVLLLPKISEESVGNSSDKVVKTTKKAIQYGLLLGFAFNLIFLATGKYIGTYIFSSSEASAYICRLSFICPFLYTNSLLGSILHGLGRPGSVLLINICSSSIRIIMILFLVPGYGIGAILWGMLVSQIFTTFSMMYLVFTYHSN